MTVKVDFKTLKGDYCRFRSKIYLKNPQSPILPCLTAVKKSPKKNFLDQIHGAFFAAKAKTEALNGFLRGKLQNQCILP